VGIARLVEDEGRTLRSLESVEGSLRSDAGGDALREFE